MPRFSALFACLLALLVAASCQDDKPSLPSDPGSLSVSGKGTCPAEDLIKDLFPKGLSNAATQQCRNIQRQFARGKVEDAYDKLADLTGFILEHLQNGRLSDPDGSGPETAASGAADLIVQIHAIVGLASVGDEIPAAAFTSDGGVVQTVDAEDEWHVVTRDGFAAINKRAGVPVFLNGAPYNGPVTLFIAPIEPSASGFPSFGLAIGGPDRGAFPLFKDIGSIPAGIQFGDGAITETPNPQNELVVELCIVDPPHPLAPLSSQLPDVRVGHIVDGTEVEATPLRSSTLDCTGVNDEVVAGVENRWHRWANAALAPAARFFDVAKLHAEPGRLGGAISSFSEFGGVDRTKVSDGGGGDDGGDLENFQTFFSTDVAAAGVGGLRDVGTGTITLSGVSGPVTSAFLYWQGPTDTGDPAANASVLVNGTPVVGTNIGFSSDNCWEYENSQAYRADVTALVQSTGNGTYELTGFGSGRPVNTNGASLIVFFDDGNASNDRDVVILDGNDSNIDNVFDDSGWNATVTGIDYSGGDAFLRLHVGDGQSFPDAALILNGSTLAPAGPLFEGASVPSANNGPDGSGSLWDIRAFEITAFLDSGPNTLTLTSGVNADCLALIVTLVDVPAGSAPVASRTPQR